MKEAKPSRIRYSEHIEGDSAAIYRNACRLQLEGIVSKRKDSPYRSGREGAWEKVKCTRRGEFPIIGFVPAPGGMVAALYLGRRENRALFYAGKVGTGFTHDQSRMMRQKLERFVTDRPAIWRKYGISAATTTGASTVQDDLIIPNEVRSFDNSDAATNLP